MKRPATWLLDHAANTHSQCGEDGVLAKVLTTLPERDRWCVEFGAWDGKHLSNTCRLITEDGYSAVLIEASQRKMQDLCRTFDGNPNVYPIHAFVGWEGATRLDALLAATPIPQRFDLLSIDIDGNDYHVWEAVADYRPKVVIIEFNPTIPTALDYVQPAAPELSRGCSAKALERLGKAKGYELVCVLPWNCVFVDRDYFPLFEIDDNRVETLRTTDEHVTWMFSGYDGEIIIEGGRKLPWHGLPIVPASLQQLPRFLRHYPSNMGKLRRNMVGLLRAVARLRCGSDSR